MQENLPAATYTPFTFICAVRSQTASRTF